LPLLLVGLVGLLIGCVLGGVIGVAVGHFTDHRMGPGHSRYGPGFRRPQIGPPGPAVPRPTLPSPTAS